MGAYKILIIFKLDYDLRLFLTIKINHIVLSPAPTIVLMVSGAPFTVAMYSVSMEPGGVWPAMTDILLSTLEKWNRWKIFKPCIFFRVDTTVSPA